MSVIETAAALYRTMKRRGMHLRHGHGRDYALYTSLQIRLGCNSDTQLQDYLDGSSLSAEDFLREFITLALPFARMFQDIWKYLATEQAPRATEDIRVRFGFRKDAIDLDMQQFREYASIASELEEHSLFQWPEAAQHALFDLACILLGYKVGEVPDDWEGYIPRIHRSLPQVDVSAHRCDRIVVAIRLHLQSLIELDGQQAVENQRLSPNVDPHVFLTDILPWWHRVLSEWPRVDNTRRDDGADYYEKAVQPLLNASREKRMRKALDILRLPFWKHRWHTYEIWLTVLTLQVLAPFKPTPRVRGGYIAIDTQSSSIIATLSVDCYPSACIVTQMETPFMSGGRKAIRPDISICFDKRRRSDSRSVVVEVKQREQLTTAHITEVGIAYKEGSPRASGVLFVNYDSSGVLDRELKDVCLVAGLTPLEPRAIRKYTETLSELLGRAGLRPLARTFVLLDVSESMGGKYEGTSFQRELVRLLKIPGTTAWRFSDELLDPGGLRPGTVFTATAGGTDVTKTLDQVFMTFGEPEFLILISDGQFSADGRAAPSTNCFVCEPSEVLSAIEWRMRRVVSDT